MNTTPLFRHGRRARQPELAAIAEAAIRFSAPKVPVAPLLTTGGTRSNRALEGARDSEPHGNIDPRGGLAWRETSTEPGQTSIPGRRPLHSRRPQGAHFYRWQQRLQQGQSFPGCVPRTTETRRAPGTRSFSRSSAGFAAPRASHRGAGRIFRTLFPTFFPTRCSIFIRATKELPLISTRSRAFSRATGSDSTTGGTRRR